MRLRRMIAALLGRLNLRFPTLFVILLIVTVADLLIPDVLPFVDEIVLAVLTVLLGLWRKQREAAPGRH
jgi:hypothetical protein